MDKHVIIIGSGLGGLSCGYILAKNGYRVSLLEKNAQPGGCLQTFSRNGVKFETGMHYIGSMEKGQILHRFFNYLSLLPAVQLRSLDKTAYDIISIGDKRFPFACGTENFIESLTQHFPRERQNLQNYWRNIREIVDSSPLYSSQYSDVMLSNPAIRQSANHLIESITDNPLLQCVLAGNSPLYAGVKNTTPVYTHALINDFYNRSAYRIIGGSDVVARSLIQSIRAMGGQVLSSSQVTKINCDNARATGVSLKTGEELHGDYFISSIHPARMLELLDTPLIRRSYRERITGLKNTVANFTVYIRFRENTVPYFNSNLYHYNEPNDVWRENGPARSNRPGSFLYMHQCSSLDQQYADAAILMTYMDYEEVARWADKPGGRRGEQYESFKHQKAEQLLALLEKQMPGTQAGIDRYYTSTPLTYADYTGTEKGSMYGIVHDCNYPLQTTVSQRTKIPNLFLTGQNINFHGILGVIVSSIITSGELLGINTILKQMEEAG